jgi:CRISPR system Cascade subunit CasE
MQSDRLPENSSDMTHILACKAYNPILATGDRLRFFVTANPIKMIDDENGRKNTRGEPKKCRVPLIREDEQRTWIERKFGNVALIESMKFKPAPLMRFRKKKEDRMGKIQPVIFSGLLKVQIPDALMTLVKTGIGPAKSFGCGLISLAKI